MTSPATQTISVCSDLKPRNHFSCPKRTPCLLSSPPRAAGQRHSPAGHSGGWELLFDQGGEAVPTVPGFLNPFLDSSPGADKQRATSRGRGQQLPQPLQRDLRAEPSVSQRILLPERPPKGTRGMPKNRRLSYASSPRACRGGFLLRTWLLGERRRGSGRAETHLRVPQEEGRKRSAPDAGGCHEAVWPPTPLSQAG